MSTNKVVHVIINERFNIILTAAGIQRVPEQNQQLQEPAYELSAAQARKAKAVVVPTIAVDLISLK